MYEEEREREEGHAADHAEQRPEEERSSTDAINKAERDDGRNKVGHGDEDSKGGRLTETGLVDDFGGAVEEAKPRVSGERCSCDCDSESGHPLVHERVEACRLCAIGQNVSGNHKEGGRGGTYLLEEL